MTVFRIEVRPKRGAGAGAGDPRGNAAMREVATLGLGGAQVPSRIDASSVYLLEGDLDNADVARIAHELLADPVTEEAIIGASPAAQRGGALVEVHPLPGVMDQDAQAVEAAVRTLTGRQVAVRTGRRYDMKGIDEATARLIAERLLANTVIHAIHTQPYHPAAFPHGRTYELKVRDIPLVQLDDAALAKLSRSAHLFLSLEEMRAIQAHYRGLGREPREIELETLAQTWSEHCVHKTMKATIRYRETVDGGSPRIAIRGLRRPGHEFNADGSITIHNLLKSTVAAATHELIAGGIDWCLSVFVDNAGVIAFDDDLAVCFKCETHNHPSAIEPYGGAATGIGGCIRDIIGTGLAAKPIAATDVFCVAHPDHWSERRPEGTEAQRHAGERPDDASCFRASLPSCLPAGVLHPRRVLTQVVAGVRDYGNRMGIPALNGAVWFDDDYVANPLVFCGCIGVMPRDKIRGAARAGDRIIAIGGRTGRDGIHGATFSSAELTDTHADEFSHAVQIGNAVTEKMMLDAILAARDHEDGCLFSAITDCGAGGFSSAVGEMGRALGAEVSLEAAPLKYGGLSPTEIWISEAQERMVLAVPERSVAALRELCGLHGVEMSDLGRFGATDGSLILRYQGIEVGRLDMEFLHEGLPETVREAAWEYKSTSQRVKTSTPSAPPNISDALLALLAHPNIASKRWIIRQYDHEVQGRTVIKPLTGAPGMEGPGDAAVIKPAPFSQRGLATGNGLATGLCADPYVMALAAIDECVRNLVCVGADPARIAILDNFCWPSCNEPRHLAAFVRAAEGCYDAALAYRTPFISGKDSLNNQFTAEDGSTIRIPYTLLISGMGIVSDVRRCVTMDAKESDNLLLIVGETDERMGGSHYEIMFGMGANGTQLAQVNLDAGPRHAAAVAEVIGADLARSAHDCSEGGLLVAAAEMAFAGGLGVRLDLTLEPASPGLDLTARCFAETPSRYLLEIERSNLDAVDTVLRSRGIAYAIIGEFDESARLTLPRAGVALPIDELRAAWNGTLNW